MLPPNAQNGEGGLVGGIRAPQNAFLRTALLTRKTSAKDLQNYAAVIGSALERLKLSAAEQEAWRAIKKHVNERSQEERADATSSRNAPISNDIQGLREEIQVLTQSVKKLAEGSKQQSWAQVAKATHLAAQLPARRAREILVTCDQSTNEQNNKTAAEIVADIQSTAGGKGEIVGARKLPSGAIALTFKSAEAKDLWKEKGKVTNVFGFGATVKESTLDVIVFGFPAKTISGLRPEQRLQAIINQNRGLENSLKRVGVLKSTISRRYEAVILGFTSPQEANATIESGVLWEANVLNAEPFSKNVRLGRCFNCQSYAAHSARFCRSQAKCGWCAVPGHTLDSCTDRQNNNKKACVPCGGKKGHCALDKHCPARLREEERARAAYESRPSKFEAPSITPNQSRISEEDDEGFLVVGNKRRRGRPTAISKASTAGIPDIASFLQIPCSQFGGASPPSSLLGTESSQGTVVGSSSPISSSDKTMTDSL